MEKAKTIHTFQNRTWHCIIMPLGSKIKTKQKKWREEKDYISRNQERVKNKAASCLKDVRALLLSSELAYIVAVLPTSSRDTAGPQPPHKQAVDTAAGWWGWLVSQLHCHIGQGTEMP